MEITYLYSSHTADKLLSNDFAANHFREHPKCVKIYFVIASVMKWSEAIAKSRCCDCFIPQLLETLPRTLHSQ
jgi:hypothetical protein